MAITERPDVWEHGRGGRMVVSAQTTMASLIAARGRRRNVAPGEVLFRETDRSTTVYECLAGRLRLSMATSGGRDVLLDLILPGDVFGEWAALDGHARTTSAVAVAPSAVAEVAGEEFVAAIRSDPDLAMASLRGLTRQLRRANARICSDETELVGSRTAHLLAELDDRFRPSRESDAPVGIPITQSDLADWLGATREATARALAELRRSGAIATARSLITVVDRRALALASR